MWILLAEAALALGLLIFIVWWTMTPPKTNKTSSEASTETSKPD